MTSLSPQGSAAPIMHLSVREVRMIVERILLVAGLPDGFVSAVRDCILHSEAEGLGGLGILRRDFDHLKNANLRALLISPEPGAPKLDAAHQHAWIVAPGLFDLALADYRAGEGGKATVHNVTEAAELNLLRGYASRYGARADITVSDGIATIQITGDGLTNADDVMARILAEGMPVSKALWQDLYTWSHDALTPDSIVSRRHAGPVMVDAEGKIHGRDDDDTDFALLGVSQTNAAPENA